MRLIHARWSRRGSCPRAGPFSAVVLALAMLTAGEAALAARPCTAPDEAYRKAQTEVVREVRLERIAAADLLEDVRRVRRLTHRSELFAPPPAVRRVTRRLPRLWTRRVPPDLPLEALRVDHRVSAAGLDSATAVQRSDVTLDLPVRIRPTRPRLVCRGPGYKIVEGGVIVEFALNRLPAAGRYHFDIETQVTVP